MELSKFADQLVSLTSHLTVLQVLDINTLILFLAVITGLFVFWLESKKDGFDEEKANDFYLLSLVTGIIMGRFAYAVSLDLSIRDTITTILRFWEQNLNIIGFVVGALIPLGFFPKFWKWSFYRLSDILVISYSLSFSIVLAGWYVQSRETLHLVGSLAFLVLFLGLRKSRMTFTSGLSFTIFIVYIVLFGLILYREPIHLIFYSLLITIGIINIRNRFYGKHMTNLPKAFIENMKNVLKKKDKQLLVEQKQLLTDDPYMQPGRDSDNEYLDDVREDLDKSVSDMKLSMVRDMRVRVRKALAMIKIGKYGTCEVCGKPISIERLKVYPEATTCLEHAN